MAGPAFPCGCPRTGDYVLTFKNGKVGLSTRCRACHTAYVIAREAHVRDE